MKAVRFHEFGGTNVLRYEDGPTPQPGPGEVLVKVAATAFNPLDRWLRLGAMQEILPVRLPQHVWASTLPEQSSTTAPASRTRPSGARSSASFP